MYGKSFHNNDHDSLCIIFVIKVLSRWPWRTSCFIYFYVYHVSSNCDHNYIVKYHKQKYGEERANRRTKYKLTNGRADMKNLIFFTRIISNQNTCIPAEFPVMCKILFLAVHVRLLAVWFRFWMVIIFSIIITTWICYGYRTSLWWLRLPCWYRTSPLCHLLHTK